MSRFISPSIDQIDKLRTPLTNGEKKVLDFFCKNLSEKWEIYIQPHLNGLRPDFVLLNEDVGIAVYEIKDWNLNAMNYFVENNKLFASNDKNKILLEKNNPISKIKLYKQEIYNLYCPRLSSDSNSTKTYAVISAGIIFPFSNTNSVRELFNNFLNDTERKYITISGYSEIENNKIYSVFPDAKRNKSNYMSSDYANDLRGWLVEPTFAAIQRTKPNLDSQQISIVKTRTQSGYRRIKGPAGSGKTLVLAGRAAYLANQGKKVLICTFNITLFNYIKDIVVRFLDNPKNINNITLINFHQLCKRICYSNSMEKEYLDTFKEGEGYALSELIPNLVLKISKNLDNKMFDSVFVDEGQDFKPLWWNVLRNICDDKGEKILIADTTQDIYDTAKAWTDEVMTGLGFQGRWTQLEYTYRMPTDLIEIAYYFAKNYFKDENIELPKENKYIQKDLLDKCELNWIQSNKNNLINDVKIAVEKMMTVTGKKNKVSNSEIMIIVDSKEIGSEIANLLIDKNIKILDTFSSDQKIERTKKISFFMGDARVKITTIHSLKGWECRLLIIVIAKAKTSQELHLFYTALTRLQKNYNGSWLTVVCAENELLEFGKKFFNFSDNSNNNFYCAEGNTLNDLGIECGLEGCSLTNDEKDVFYK